MTLADRVNRIQPSQTLAVTALVAELRHQGKDIIDLGAGEPDFNTPEPVREAAIAAINAGFTKYTPASGTLELKEAICEKLKTENGLEYQPNQILVTCGAKHAVINALLVLCQKDDEVIIPTPYWTSYVEQVNFVGARPVLVETDEQTGFKITPDQLEEALTSRTRVLILNSPSNPTGAVYSEEELQALAGVLSRHEVFILSDEIYEKILYDGRRHHSLAQWPDLKPRCIVVNGASKAFAMTGWRIGYLAAEEEIVKAALKIQSHSTSNPCSISQKASVAALRGGDRLVAPMLAAFQERRDFLFERLQQLPGFRCSKPGGAFYMFPDVTHWFGAEHDGTVLANNTDFCTFLLEQAGVALVPGSAFGSERHVRISYATSIEQLQAAMERVEAALNRLHV